MSEQTTYVNPFTDFGFKRLFGEDANKRLLLDFLNELLHLNSKITEITFKSPEQMGDTKKDRRAVYDIYCTTEDGTFFIVEMQKAFQAYFKDRTVFYSTFPIRAQAKKGLWDYKLSTVYCVAILAFKFAQDEYRNEYEEVFEDDYLHKVELKDQHNRPFYKKLKYIFIEMPCFEKTEAQLNSRFEKWVYFLKNLEIFDEIPTILNEPIFQEAFEVAKIANFNKKQLSAYNESVKNYRDLHSVVKSAVDKAVVEAIDTTKKNTIIRTLKRGKATIEEIAEYNDVSVELVLAIQNELENE
jgi:predicted transposase/invertase (TIGR01784 family)